MYRDIESIAQMKSLVFNTGQLFTLIGQLAYIPCRYMYKYTHALMYVRMYVDIHVYVSE